MNCSNCGLKMVQSGTGFLCPSCGHTELTANVPKSEATSSTGTPPQQRTTAVRDTIVATPPLPRAPTPELNPVTAPTPQASTPALPVATKPTINMVAAPPVAASLIPAATP